MSWWSVEVQPASQPRWCCPAPAVRFWCWMPAIPAMPPRRTCRASCPATGCHRPSCWPAAATKFAATAAGSSPATVEDITSGHDAGFRVLFDGGQAVTARRILVATGLRDELPDIPGLQERWARDVLHCPYCHGYEVRDRPLGVLGTTPAAVRYAQIVRQWSDDVVLFAPEGMLTEAQRTELVARAVGLVEGTVGRILIEDDRLRGVQMDDGRIVARDVLFVPPRFVPHNDLLAALGCRPRRDRMGSSRFHRRNHRPRTLGRREPGQPSRSGHHRRRRGVRGRHRHQRRPRRRGRPEGRQDFHLGASV